MLPLAVVRRVPALCYISSREMEVRGTCGGGGGALGWWWSKWREMGYLVCVTATLAQVCFVLASSLQLQPTVLFPRLHRGQPLTDMMRHRCALPSSRCEIEVRGKSCRGSVTGWLLNGGRESVSP
jgi:hypothetical protein